MTKHILLVIFTGICCTNNIISYDFTNEKLDQSLLELTYKINNSKDSHIKIQNNIDQISFHWNSEMEELRHNRDVSIEAKKSFTDRIDAKMKKLSEAVANTQLNKVPRIAKEILYEFKNARLKNHITDYPLDDLLNMAEAYEDIEITINDQMFDLQCWFEFEDMLSNYMTSWDKYQTYHIQEIQNYFNYINAEDHQYIKEKIKECTLTFMDSLLSGYQPDFQVPCDELGKSIHDLLVLYSNNDENFQN
jgi:hypothetical protein